MKIIRITYYILTTLTLLWVGCSKNIEQPTQPSEISFHATIDNSLPDGTKAHADTRAVAADLNATGMLINGFYSNISLSQANFNTEAKPVFTKLEMGGDGSYSGNRFFWASTSTYYHFWGHNNIKPITEDGEQCGIVADDQSVNGGVITFVQANNPQNMYDLVLAEPAWNKKSNEGITQDVELMFKHSLARINFSIYNPNMTQLNNCKIYITYAENTFKREADFVLYNRVMTKSDTKFHSGTHLLAPAFDMPSSSTTAEKAWFAGSMILLPQQMPEASITITIQYTIDGTKEEKTVEAPMPAGTLSEGYAYTYYLMIDAKAASLKVTDLQLIPWNVIYSADIPMFDY